MSTVSPSIATVDYYATHNGVAVGSTTSNTFGFLEVGHPRACTITRKANTGGDKVMSVVIHFTGSKTSGDNLIFLKAQAVCSETLGLKDCTPSTGYWTWNLEGEANVYDDASNWTVLVT